MNPVTGLSLGRLAIGGAAVAAPDLTAKLFQLDTDDNRQLSYMVRLFGARELFMGALTLSARGRARRDLVLGGIAVDGVDALAGALAGRAGTVSRPASAMLVAPAVSAVVVGAVALTRGR